MKRWFLLTILMAGLAVLSACASVFAAEPGSDGRIEVVMRDNRYEPKVIRVKAGQTVEIVLRNEGQKLHEFMIGRDVRVEGNLTEGFATDFFAGLDLQIDGPGMVMGLPGGMEGVDMGGNDGHAAEAGGMDTGSESGGMDMGGNDGHAAETGGMDMGQADEHGADGHGAGDFGEFGAFQISQLEAGHAGIMVMIDPTMIPASEQTVIRMTIPADRVGTWQFGCFQERGQHYDDGMRGTLIVEP